MRMSVSQLNPLKILSHRSLFHFWERCGIHVTPVNFYQPIPNTRELGSHDWGRARPLPGVDLDARRMLTLLVEMGAAHLPEFASKLRSGELHPFRIDNGFFESVDAEVLYALVRRTKPRKIIEIGCGNSSLVFDAALRANSAEDPSSDCELLLVDPFPSPLLQHLQWRNRRLLSTPVQQLPASETRSLAPGDILFIDSSHVLATGSDVEYEFRELIPSVQPGVLVHVHDVFTPRDYPKEWLMRSRLFWTEQYALELFLSFNSAFEVLWAGNFMRHAHADALDRSISSFGKGVEPGSFWMRRR